MTTSDLTEAARELWALLHNGRRPEGYWDAESERYYRRVVESFLTSPAVQAVARALVGMDGRTGTEWAAYWGADSPEAEFSLLPLGPSGFVECEDREDAEDFAKNHGGKVARRTVTRSPWQVVGTEPDTQAEPDPAAQVHQAIDLLQRAADSLGGMDGVAGLLTALDAVVDQMTDYYGDPVVEPAQVAVARVLVRADTTDPAALGGASVGQPIEQYTHDGAP